MRAVTRVNSVLNYGFSLLEAAARTAAHRVGLHPEIGFLHVESPHKEPLVYDLQEFGRAWVEEAVLDWFSDPKHQKGFYRTPEWVMHLGAEAAQELVEFVAPRVRLEALVQDGRRIVGQLET